MDIFVWPGVVLILGLVFMFLFKKPLSTFIDRTESVGKDGVRTRKDAPQEVQKADALAAFLETYHSPMLLEVEGNIEAEIAQRHLTAPEDVRRALVKSLAGSLILLNFERLHRIIFGSQAAALILVNGTVGPTPVSDVEALYTEAVGKFPKVYEGRSFEEWLEFLTGQALLLREGDGLEITVKGREYLKWRIDMGRSGPYYG